MSSKAFLQLYFENEQKRMMAKDAGKGHLPSPVIRKPLRPIIVVGPAGVGKSTLIAKLLEKYPDQFGFEISYTTRKPRPEE